MSDFLRRLLCAKGSKIYIFSPDFCPKLQAHIPTSWFDLSAWRSVNNSNLPCPKGNSSVALLWKKQWNHVLCASFPISFDCSSRLLVAQYKNLLFNPSGSVGGFILKLLPDGVHHFPLPTPCSEPLSFLTWVTAIGFELSPHFCHWLSRFCFSYSIQGDPFEISNWIISVLCSKAWNGFPFHPEKSQSLHNSPYRNPPTTSGLLLPPPLSCCVSDFAPCPLHWVPLPGRPSTLLPCASYWQFPLS